MAVTRCISLQCETAALSCTAIALQLALRKWFIVAADSMKDFWGDSCF